VNNVVEPSAAVAEKSSRVSAMSSAEPSFGGEVELERSA
jgi:hypothetical protein